MAGTMSQAAAAVLLRRAPDAPEVYVIRRSMDLDFLGGFHAFAGGTSEPIDAQLCDGDPRTATAIRELFEETGVLLAEGSQPMTPAERTRLRETLIAGDGSAWASALHSHELRLPVERLLPMGRWITPPYAAAQFDARYYGLWLPENESPEIWPGELTEGVWVTARDALARYRRGELFLTFPVLETLRTLALHGADVESAARDLEERSRTRPSHLEAGGELLAGVHIVPVRTFTLPPATHTNCYVLGDEELVVVDPASPIEEEQQRLADYLEHLCREGRRVREIWLTHHHRDHIGGVEHLRRAFAAPVAAHALTAEALAGEIRVDRLIENGEVTELALPGAPPAHWVALHTPGHARGHLCFWEQRLGTLISGDNVVGVGTVIIAPPEGDMGVYLDSLARMRDRELGFLFGAHGPPVARARDRIQFYIDHRLERERSVLDALTDGPLTTAEIVPLVYTDVDPMVYPLAEINVRAHLDKLVREGTVRVDGERFHAGQN